MWLVDELSDKAGPAALPVTVSGLTLGGVALQDWVYILTIVYLLFQICKSVAKGIRWWRSKQ